MEKDKVHGRGMVLLFTMHPSPRQKRWGLLKGTARVENGELWLDRGPDKSAVRLPAPWFERITFLPLFMRPYLPEITHAILLEVDTLPPEVDFLLEQGSETPLPSRRDDGSRFSLN